MAVNDTIVKASHNTGACYGIEKCAEVVFEHGLMVKEEGLEILEQRMQSLDPSSHDTYKFLGVEQADGIQKEKVLQRVKAEMQVRLKKLLQLELYDGNLIRATNRKVIPVAAYPMNVCRFSMNDVNELDMIVKRELRSCNMLGRQSSDERLYLSRNIGGRGLILLRDVYGETKVRVACYMAKSTSKWIRTAWERECASQYCSIRRDAEVVLREIGCVLEFRGNEIVCDGECLAADWKKCWKRLKQLLKKKTVTKRVSEYKLKEMQSEIFKG